MIYAYIGAALIVGLLVGLVTISVIWTMKVINRSIRDKSVELISVYDELFDQKSRELNQLTDEIKRQREYMERLEKYSDSFGNGSGNGTGTENSAAEYLRATELMTQTTYLESGISDIYQVVRGKFNFDVKSLMEQIPTSKDNSSAIIKNIMDKIPYETVYKMSSLTNDDQYGLISECMDSSEKKILDEYMELHNDFDIIIFYDWIKSMHQQKNSEKVLWTVENEYDDLKKLGYITVPDGDICEGVMIEANGKIHDYSIRKREIG